MISRFLIGVALATLLAVSAVSAGEPGRPGSAETIIFHADTLYPESMSWSARHGEFFIGSVGTVDLNGSYKPFSTDDSWYRPLAFWSMTHATGRQSPIPIQVQEREPAPHPSASWPAWRSTT